MTVIQTMLSGGMQKREEKGKEALDVDVAVSKSIPIESVIDDGGHNGDGGFLSRISTLHPSPLQF